jgi:hypothetical protein
VKIKAIVYLTDERNGNTLEVTVELPPTQQIHMREMYEVGSIHEIDKRATDTMVSFVRNLFRVTPDVISKRQLKGG